MQGRHSTATSLRLAPLAAVLAAVLTGTAGAVELPSDEDRVLLERKYRELLAEIEEVERQQRVVDALIVRAEALGELRGRGAEPSEPGGAGPQAAGPGAADGAATPVVAADRQAEYEEQQSMPELPRVSSEIGGVLTPKGRVVLEPSVGYSYSSVNRVAIEGFTILPALLVGIIDIAEADRQTYTSSLSVRYGLTNRLEMDVKGSYVYRDDSTRSREFLRDSVRESIFNSQGDGAGDYELGLRYQFKRRSPTAPYLVGNLRYKADNGTDPFEIAYQSQLTGEPQFSNLLPTGSGFKSLSPSLSFIYPSDPVVFFGSLGYMWTQEDDKGKSVDDEGNIIGFGVVDPGDALRMSFGLGLGLNDRSSLSISYALDRFSKTWIETAAEQEIAGSDATVGKLMVGYSMRLASGTPLNIAFGLGTTGDAPDTDLSFRMPFNLRK